MSKPGKSKQIEMLKTHRDRISRQIDANQAMAADVAKSNYGRILGREIVRKRAWRFFCIISIAGNIVMVALCLIH